MMSPLRSAIGMKSLGAMVPRVGGDQRISASTPVICSLCRSKVG